MATLLRRLDVGAVPRGFRSSFRDWAAEFTDAPREVCELALAHVNSDRVEAAYRRGDLFERRRRLMADWAPRSPDRASFSPKPGQGPAGRPARPCRRVGDHALPAGSGRAGTCRGSARCVAASFGNLATRPLPLPSRRAIPPRPVAENPGHARSVPWSIRDAGIGRTMLSVPIRGEGASFGPSPSRLRRPEPLARSRPIRVTVPRASALRAAGPR